MNLFEIILAINQDVCIVLIMNSYFSSRKVLNLTEENDMNNTSIESPKYSYTFEAVNAKINVLKSDGIDWYNIESCIDAWFGYGSFSQWKMDVA